MNCLKCGVEIPERQCFCEKCRAAMEGYPVRSDAPVWIPKRQTAPTPKKQRRQLKPEEQIARLRKSNLRLRILAGALAALLIAGAAAAFLYFRRNPDRPSKGQNFSTLTDDTTGGAP